MSRSLPAILSVLVLTACGGGDTASGVDAPGREESAKTRALDAGAAAIQDKPPIEAINAYLEVSTSTTGAWRRRWRPTTTARCSTKTSSSA